MNERRLSQLLLQVDLAKHLLDQLKVSDALAEDLGIEVAHLPEVVEVARLLQSISEELSQEFRSLSRDLRNGASPEYRRLRNSASESQSSDVNLTGLEMRIEALENLSGISPGLLEREAARVRAKSNMTKMKQAAKSASRERIRTSSEASANTSETNGKK